MASSVCCLVASPFCESQVGRLNAFSRPQDFRKPEIRVSVAVAVRLHKVCSSRRLSSCRSLETSGFLAQVRSRCQVSQRQYAARGRTETRAEAGADSEAKEKTPFGYTRKDVLLIGVGILGAGILMKYGLEFVGVDPLQAGNVVQLVLVLGLMVGWTVTYVFRVGNKEMTYVKQLKDYEDAVMKKRLEELPDAELEAMLAEVEEEKRRISERRAKKKSA